MPERTHRRGGTAPTRRKRGVEPVRQPFAGSGSDSPFSRRRLPLASGEGKERGIVEQSPRSRPPRSATFGGQEAATVKLQKRLAEAGLGSRRAMEELIQSGQVTINGRVAKLGARVTLSDRITVAGKLVGRGPAKGPLRQPSIVLYHKPEGEIVSRSDPQGRPSVFDRVPMVKRGRWLAVGRLDFNTCGLLIFTDSGELANRLTHPRYRARRDYAVRIVGELNPEHIRRLRTGIQLDDGPAQFEVLEPQGGEGTNRWYRVRVREGRNRLVRRMFAALGFTVSRLMRTSFGPFELPPRIKRGQWLRLDPDETRQALLGLEREEGGAAARRPARVTKEGFVGAGHGAGQTGRAAAAAPHRRRRQFRAR